MGILTLLSSCQKVIDVKLNSAASRLVIEGNIDDAPGPYLVQITKTVDFDQNNTFPGVADAFVTIADNLGNVDTLLHNGAGKYYTQRLVGRVGTTYTLTAVVGNQTYTATSRMPQVVPIDSLYSLVSTPFGNNITYMVPVFQDPVDQQNFYNFQLFINGRQSKGVYVTDDAFINGQKLSLSLFPSGGPNSNNDEIKKGDSVAVVLQAIDNGTYQYYFSLDQNINQSSASPANPTSNIKGGALGYFSAHATSTRAIVIP
jgi:hypothetical protein